MMVGSAMFCAGDARVLPSMAKRCLQKIRSRHPGYANLFDTPAQNITLPTITVRLVERQGDGNTGRWNHMLVETRAGGNAGWWNHVVVEPHGGESHVGGDMGRWKRGCGTTC